MLRLVLLLAPPPPPSRFNNSDALVPSRPTASVSPANTFSIKVERVGGIGISFAGSTTTAASAPASAPAAAAAAAAPVLLLSAFLFDFIVAFFFAFSHTPTLCSMLAVVEIQVSQSSR